MPMERLVATVEMEPIKPMRRMSRKNGQRSVTLRKDGLEQAVARPQVGCERQRAGEVVQQQRDGADRNAQRRHRTPAEDQ